MCLKYDEGNKKIKATIHNYYLGVEKSIAEQIGETYGDVDMSPEELVCRLELIKAQVRRNPKFTCIDDDFAVSSSEKSIQANLYKSGLYIDTEFQVQLDNGTDIRIDLVSITDENLVQFEELKRIGDSRMMSGDPKKAEILKQMDHYSEFITATSLLEEDGELLITRYYQKVLNIMSKINVLPIRLKDRKVKGLSRHVILYIDCSAYTKRTSRRDKRLANLKEILQEKGYHSNIDEVLNIYQKLPK